MPILFLASTPLADAAPADHVSVGTEQVIAPMFKICLLPIGPIPPIICIGLNDGQPSTSSNPPPPPPPTSPPPPPPPTTPTKPPPPITRSAAPPPPTTPGAPTSVGLRAAVAPPALTPTTTPTTTPPSTAAAAPTTQSGRAAVLPTSPGTLREASVSPEVVTERRWALTAIVLIFGAGAIATARMRRRPKG